MIVGLTQNLHAPGFDKVTKTIDHLRTKMLHLLKSDTRDTEADFEIRILLEKIEKKTIGWQIRFVRHLLKYPAIIKVG